MAFIYYMNPYCYCIVFFHLEVKQCAFVGLIGKAKGHVHRLAGITEAMSNAQNVLQKI